MFSEIVQTALTQYRVPPNDAGAERQFDVARARADEAGNNCTVPHGAALQQVLAQRAAARSRGAGGRRRRARPGRAA